MKITSSSQLFLLYFTENNWSVFSSLHSMIPCLIFNCKATLIGKRWNWSFYLFCWKVINYFFWTKQLIFVKTFSNGRKVSILRNIMIFSQFCQHLVNLQIQRLPCLPSSMVALDTLMGTDESLGFEDFLNGNFRYYSKIVFKTFPNKLQYFCSLKMVFHIL